jgi:hypothetical protein
MFMAANGVSVPKFSAVVLVAAALAVPMPAVGQDGGLNVGVGVSLGSVKADVDATVGGSKGLADANVGASLGGTSGINADAKTNVGGARGLVDSDVTASIGGSDGVNARAVANAGGSRGLLDADVDANVGGSRGLGANVDANVGGRGLLNANIGLGSTEANPGNAGGSSIGTAGRDREILRQFSQLSRSERATLIKRCGGVDSGGYDAGLVGLCRLLQTASR